jgi:signal transduction histidine kinase
MVPLSPSPDRRPRVTPVMALLLLTLGLTGVLTYQAVDAAASHRKTAQRALDDYATFAAWEYSRLARKELDYYLWGYAQPLQYFQPEAATALPTEVALDKARTKLVHCDDCGADLVRAYFALDLDGGGMVWVGDSVSEALRGWIRDTLCVHASTLYEKKWDFAFVVGSPGGARTDVGYYVRRDAWENPTRIAYGFLLSDSLLPSALTYPWRKGTLLPSALTGVDTNDSLLALTVADGAGRPIFEGGRALPRRFVGRDTVGRQFGGLAVNVVLDPAAAGGLIIGGLPHSRVPLLVGLLALTAGLIIVALRQLRRESELARLRSDFVSGVSHELRTPLAQIRMFAETLLLERVRTDEERHRALDIVNRESQRLTHLVDNVLQFSRAERGTMRVAPEPARLDRLLADVVDCFAPLAASRGVRLRLLTDEAITAPVDAGALRQVVLNLLDNAVKYGPAGQTVTLALAAERGAAVVSVEDEGPGIPEEARARVWEPYWRLPRDGASAVGGSGIGLAVVRDLMEAHGGSATVTATANGGARFAVRFPGAALAATALTARAALTARSAP